jgi:heme/copper-type cytochrome/quinol oxidase subunit 2
MIRSRLASVLLALAAAGGPLAALAEEDGKESGWAQLNMTQGVTEMSRHIYDLHMEIFWICVVIALIVFGVMIYSLVKFRKSQGAIADVTQVHNTKVEIIWTIVRWRSWCSWRCRRPRPWCRSRTPPRAS